jgi:hypothetical protein
MSITATVENDTIKLPAGSLPNGTQVRIEAVSVEPPKSFAERYAKYIGCVKDTPPDLASNVDHYLYGAPKRKP